MDQEKKNAIALMRYSVIAPLITGLSDEYASLTAFYDAASVKGVAHPDGTIKHYAPETIENWFLKYKKNGFEALVPTGRGDQGKPRKLDDELQEEIKYIKTNYPRMSASAIYRQLQSDGRIKNGEISESTINRYSNLLEVQMKTTTNPDMRRYERPHINEVWCGDTSVGPYLKLPDGKKHKVYIIALIDDASRFIVGVDVFLMTISSTLCLLLNLPLQNTDVRKCLISIMAVPLKTDRWNFLQHESDLFCILTSHTLRYRRQR